MEKRYQVFVSSTYIDLREERLAVIQALLGIDCIPSGMELFPAADDDQWTLIKRVIDDCDYYLAIIGGRYGSIGVDEKSYTQMEYEYALEQKKPVIAFLHGNTKEIPPDKTDPENATRLEAFRVLAQRKVCKSWTTPHDLSSAVVLSMVSLRRDRPAIGWVRANHVPDELEIREILALRRENEELRKIIEVVRSESPKGAESFASGDETLDVHFSYTNLQQETIREVIPLTWNRIFATLAPLMIDGATDAELINKMQELYRNLMHDTRGISAYSAAIRDEDFQKIKVQFRALGIMAQASKVMNSITLKSWILTPYGDTLLSQLVAIRSNKSPR